jgi:hypothetical protein
MARKIPIIKECAWAWSIANLPDEPDASCHLEISNRIRLRVYFKCLRAPMLRHLLNAAAVPGMSQFGSPLSRAYAWITSKIFRYKYSIAMLFQSLETKQTAFRSEYSESYGMLLVNAALLWDVVQVNAGVAHIPVSSA